MRLVLAIHHFPPVYTGGAEVYTLRLAHWLQAHGHHVEVVCIEAIDEGRVGELRVTASAHEGIPVHRLAFNLLDAKARRTWEYDNPLIGAWFKTYLQEFEPDLVHFQAGYLMGAAPLEAALQVRIPTVLTLHDYWFLCPRITLLRGDGTLCTQVPDDPTECAWCLRLASRRFRIPDQLTGGRLGRVAQATVLGSEGESVAARRIRLLALLRQVDAVIAPSEFIAKQFQTVLAPNRPVVLGFGTESLKLPPGRRRSPEGELHIGYIGQVVPHKGVHLLVKAFRQLQTAGQAIHLDIHGGLDRYPDYVRRLRRLAGRDPRIHFHGRFENARVGEILNGLDMIVVPSIWYENSPVAILEARAAGTPAIVAALGGMPELVCDGRDGLHVKPNSVDDLTHKLQQLVDRPALLRHLQSSVVPPRRVDVEMCRLTSIYQDVLARRPVAPEEAWVNE